MHHKPQWLAFTLALALPLAAHAVTGDPQAGQKACVFTLPLSPTTSHCIALPASLTPGRPG